MISKMLRNAAALAALLTAGLLMGCGVSSRGPNGSYHQTTTGVTEYDFPGGQSKDAESPALASSSEQQYSRDQKEKAE
jgi:hypothetical protein